MSQKVEIKKVYRSLSLAYDEPCPYILWVSRHPPLPAQIQALEKKLGKIHVVQMSGLIPNAEFVVDYIKMIDRKRHPEIYVVPVLPLSFIARLVELARKNGFTVLWAEMEMVKQVSHQPQPNKDYDPSIEAWIKGYEGIFKIMRFKGFRVIKEVKLVLEDW